MQCVATFVLLCGDVQTLAAEIIFTFLWFEMCYYECLWPMTESHYQQQLGKEGGVQEDKG